MKKLDAMHQQVDECLQDGDYVQALEKLQKLGPINKKARSQINDTITRIQRIATTEFVAGRWSVAEGIFDVVQQHMELLEPDRREECKLLIKELERCRENERESAMIRAAAHLASERLYGEARVVAINALQVCREPHMVGRLRRLMAGLPHPQGKYLAGFDSPFEVRQFWRKEGGASLDIIFDRKDNIPGGYGHIILPGGSGIHLKDVPIDWSECSELRLLARTPDSTPAAFSVVITTRTGSLEFPLAISEDEWSAVRLKLTDFEKHGEPSLDSVETLGISNLGQDVEQFHLDEMRLK